MLSDATFDKGTGNMIYFQQHYQWPQSVQDYALISSEQGFQLTYSMLSQKAESFMP